MSELESLCVEALNSWDSDGDISEAMEKIRLHLALFPPDKTKKRGARKTSIKGAGSCILPPLPDFAEPYREHLQLWWEQRKQAHKGRAKDEISSRTVSALDNARTLGVLEEFCVFASEASWLSLGFAGYTEILEKLARDKTFTPSAPISKLNRGNGRMYQQQTEKDMTNHPAYQPLNIDLSEDEKDEGEEDGGGEDVFF
jgi:hypothetical protein